MELPIALYNSPTSCNTIWMRRSFVIVLAVMLLLAVCGLPLAHANEPPTRIIAIHYPATVQTGELFAVRIQVMYSARFGMMDVGIWDLGTGSVIQSLVTNATLSGPGYGDYIFYLKAPQSPCEWRLVAITRAWVQDAWFNDQAGESAFSVQVAEDGFLALNNLQPNLSISLDGRSLISNSSTMVIRLKLGSIHSLGVSEQLQSGNGRRLVFTGWSDGLTSNPRIILITENTSIQPIYMTQYLLTVTSSMSAVAGAGWYQEGKVAQFGIPTTIEDSSSYFGLFTDSSKFIGWSGDSTYTEPVNTILMDGPKTVSAQWVHSSTILNLNGIGAIFILASVVLGLNAWRLSRHRFTRHGKSRIIRSLVVMSLILIPIIAPLSPVLGQLPVPGNSDVVKIGDASWYYWEQPASDTCILWLGGGVEYSQGGYLLNPFEYESFGTIRFLQDLTKYYCLLSLERGANPSPNMSNRTIYQELIQGQFYVGKQLHQWIKAQGYTHIFLVGYSVGTEAAASMATSDPQTWTSSDGLILITAWLPPAVINGGSSLNSNLMMLYGHAPTFQQSGLQFYQKAPSEGWHRSGYLHKEFHVLDQMGHEVWSPLKDNSYSSIALGLTVTFIETSKALQFSQVAFKSTAIEQSKLTYTISHVEVSPTVLWGDVFFANAIVRSINRSDLNTAFAAYDFSTNRILSINQFNGTSLPMNIRLNMPPIVNSSKSSFSLFVLAKDGNKWKVASNPYPATVTATNQIVLRISGLVPNSDLIVDSTEYVVPNTGQVQIEIDRGLHNYEVQRTVNENDTRYLFVKWDDSNMSAARSAILSENTTVKAIYRAQYFVTIYSPIGATMGSGWYDANSNVEPSLYPVASTQPELVFDSWNNGNASFQIGDAIQVQSPMVILAVWKQNELSAQINSLTFAWVLASGILFSLLLILNVKLGRRRRVRG